MLASAVRQAKVARSVGDAAHAHELYQQALAISPDDPEALLGLADMARAEGKYSDARAYYEHALIGAPSSVPALLGLADTLWDLDNKDLARTKYSELIRRAPPGSYPDRVKDRAQ
jgi:tetratricopeptide (TPR) repeat protein